MNTVNAVSTTTAPLNAGQPLTLQGANTSQPIVVKVQFNDDIRRISLPQASLELLTQRTAEAFKLPVPRVVLKYQDEEGDLITVGTVEEFEDALSRAAQHSSALRLIASTKAKKCAVVAATPATIVTAASFPSEEVQLSPSDYEAKREALKAQRKIVKEERKKLHRQAKEALKLAKCEGKMLRKQQKAKEATDPSSSCPIREKKCRLSEEERAARREAWRKMSEEERQAVRAARREAKANAKADGSEKKKCWRDLSEEERKARREARLKAKSAESTGREGCEKKKRWCDMSEEERAAIRAARHEAKMKHWHELPKEERMARREAWRKMSEPEREALRASRREARREAREKTKADATAGCDRKCWRNLSEEERAAKRQAWLNMTEEERAAKCAARRDAWRNMSEEERAAKRAACLEARRQRRDGGEGRGGCRNNRIARFVKHVTVPDDSIFEPNQAFVKTWRIRNEGPLEWINCKLVFVSRVHGDLMGAPEEVSLPCPVPSGGEVDISVNMTAPKLPGRYVGFWRLSNAEGRKFGQRIWIKIDVVCPSSSSSDEEEDKKTTTEIPAIAMTSSSSAPSAPKEEEVEVKKTPTIAESLKRLKDMGFTDVAKNISLLKQHDGDINKTIADLLA